MDTFNGDMYLNLSFLMCAELLPVILKIIVSSFFKIFNISSIITWSKKFCDSNYVALNRTNTNFLKDCILKRLNAPMLPFLFPTSDTFKGLCGL